MKTARFALLLLAAGALAACANTTGSNTAGGGAGSDLALGDISDSTSVAYFQGQIGDRVLFVVDTSTLTPEAETILADQARFLMANGDYTAIIEGHADERGTQEYNLALGARRAAAVQDFLVSQGVAPNRLRTVTYGKERPIEICSDEACYAQNRRAVTVLGVGAGA